MLDIWQHGRIVTASMHCSCTDGIPYCGKSMKTMATLHHHCLKGFSTLNNPFLLAGSPEEHSSRGVPLLWLQRSAFICWRTEQHVFNLPAQVKAQCPLSCSCYVSMCWVLQGKRCFLLQISALANRYGSTTRKTPLLTTTFLKQTISLSNRSCSWLFTSFREPSK